MTETPFRPHRLRAGRSAELPLIQKLRIQRALRVAAKAKGKRMIEPVEAEIVGAAVVGPIQKWTVVSPFSHKFSPSMSTAFSSDTPRAPLEPNRQSPIRI